MAERLTLKNLSSALQSKISKEINTLSENEKKMQEEKKKAKALFVKKRGDLLDFLQELFPNVFDRKNPKPLKKGIQKDILSDNKKFNDKGFSNIVLRSTIAFHVNSKAYLKAVLNGEDRFDLDGNSVAKITDEEKTYSKEQLKKRYPIKNKKRNNYSKTIEI